MTAPIKIGLAKSRFNDLGSCKFGQRNDRKMEERCFFFLGGGVEYN